MLRILKFIGAFLATFLFIFLIVFGFNMNALITLFENSEEIQEGQEWVEKTQSLKGLTEYIAAQPERVTVVSLAIENPDSSIEYNAHTPRTMGRLSNLFLLINYAEKLESGDLNSDEQVPISEINKFQLPYIDASNHQDALSNMRNRGTVSADETMALTDVVRMGIEFNDLAASDYLLNRFGTDEIDDLMDRLNLEETERPLPFSGLYITLNPNLHERSYSVWMDSLSSITRTHFDSLVVSNAQKFQENQAFRDKVISTFRENEGLGISFIQLRDILDFFPKTTGLEMATLMKKIQQETLISSDVSQGVKEILNWPMNIRRMPNDFNTYGAIYDSRMGLVSGIDYGASTYSDEPFAQAIFFDELQVAFWFHMSSNLIHQDFEQRLIWDPALREATVQEIKKNQYP